MRENIYYWKCDSPHSLVQKQKLYFKEKYEQPHLKPLVYEVCTAILGAAPEDIQPLRADGNHIAFIVHCKDKKLFFRADDGSGDDDYMLAESHIMLLAANAGLPIPTVYHTDTSRSRCTLRFQLIDCSPDLSLSIYHQNGSLDLHSIGVQLGEYLRRLHTISLEGFGFINTDLLAKTGQMKGLDGCYADYFHKRLPDHLGYLVKESLLSVEDEKEIWQLFHQHGALLERRQGVLVHRDMALWNVLGTPNQITAIIDWDDAVSGDPADDIGILHCFYDGFLMDSILEGYWGLEPRSSEFMLRVWLHMLRNMLWKTVIRHSLGYFDKGSDFFINTSSKNKCSLREQTLSKLQEALTKVREMEV